MSPSSWQDRIAAGCWWGRFEVPAGATGYWRVGALEVWAQHGESEWRISAERSSDGAPSGIACRIPAESPPGVAAGAAQRFIFRRSSDALHLEPALPDRALVLHPESPIVVPPDEVATIHVGVALWLRIRTGESGITLLDAPVTRPSDTWFGPLAGEGELCYASRTRARLHLEELSASPQQAVATVHVRNLASAALAISGLRLPVTALSLYSDERCRLWTEAVELTREEDGETASLKLGANAPPNVENPTRLAGPRVVPAKRTLIRAFSSLLRIGDGDAKLARSRGYGVIDA